MERLKKAPACELLDVEDLAAKALERVKIMRVFDLVGVLEAVGEIGEGMRVDRAGFKEDEVRKVELEIKESEQKKSGQEEKQGRRTVVMDSEDEDEDMLFDAPSEPDVAPTIPEGGKGIPVAHTPNPRPLQNDHADESTENTTNPAPERISFILIDNLAHIVSPLLRKDEDQGSFT